ncbi:hypothetical protein [Mycobacterium sp. IDR2000157661]|uniref:hypothetical protein n=1 Tax=Mycobacterium sp. IDR2000157661 TaxID=2867005 RepID=UPI001EEB1825|nr:hypothetical protein [Mycobacterium sp. IDR2000157661]ULE31658.1 hypothetical protein K3G64_15780 [Mycobacterium sp. IDR2000157661]
MTGERSRLHHVVFAVSQERRETVAQMFTELGFQFNGTDLTELGVSVQLDWDGGLELISPIPGSTAGVAVSVADFLARNGDGVYTVVLRVPDAKAAESVSERYGSRTRFRQSFSGDGSYLDEVELSVFNLPVTYLSTNV